MRGQGTLKNHGLVDDVAAPEVADRDDQTGAAVAIAKIELARTRPTAAVLPLGMYQRRSSRTMRAIATVPCPKGCGQPSSCRPRIHIRRTDGLESTTVRSNGAKRSKTLGFSKYRRKSS
jgi:hypothetical protein